jgi:hypothetical protein
VTEAVSFASQTLNKVERRSLPLSWIRAAPKPSSAYNQQKSCGIFSTVLGPEANDMHRTHLHLDLQDRNSANVCK